jgi:hypothetical protein
LEPTLHRPSRHIIVPLRNIFLEEADAAMIWPRV